MIEGTLRDLSLPGLLQCLASELNTGYKVRLSSQGQSGELFIAGGFLVAASFGLLEGEDALCEFLSFREASFEVQRVEAEDPESPIKRNIMVRLEHSSTFGIQCNYLTERAVGLNSIITSSKTFGGIEWQDALRSQPLEREDFVVLGWIAEGRTMRQAMREFSFDVLRATGILYRLVMTNSIQVVRPAIARSEEGMQDLESSLVVSAATMQDAEAKAEPAAPRHKITRVDLSEVRASMQARLKEMTPARKNAPEETDDKAAPEALLERLESSISENGAAAADAPDQHEAPEAEARPPGERPFSSRRTDALPLVTIDIERLLQATFSATQFGKLALTNPSLDEKLRQTLNDVESGKTLLLVVTENDGRAPASVLSTYRYCLARGYIATSDPVIPLTADLLLGRMEIDQYLLQRRRINGDELRDLLEIEKTEGVKLTDLLVRGGYLTAGDLERLISEQKRFALK